MGTISEVKYSDLTTYSTSNIKISSPTPV